MPVPKKMDPRVDELVGLVNHEGQKQTRRSTCPISTKTGLI